MTKRILISLIPIVLLIFFGVSIAAYNESNSPKPFGLTNVRFEQNATDGDVEIVFEAKGGDEGLTNLTVVSPDGRKVIDFKTDSPSTLGMRQFQFETPEPKDVNSLKSAYPEGVYTFSGTTFSGEKLKGKSSLSHTLPATTSFLRPGIASRNVRTKNLEITWTPISNLTAYIIYIEQDDLDVSLKAKLPSSATAFKVPDNFLVSEMEYQLGLGTVMEGGNISFIETTFTTSKAE